MLIRLSIRFLRSGMQVKSSSSRQLSPISLFQALCACLKILCCLDALLSKLHPPMAQTLLTLDFETLIATALYFETAIAIRQITSDWDFAHNYESAQTAQCCGRTLRSLGKHSRPYIKIYCPTSRHTYILFCENIWSEAKMINVDQWLTGQRWCSVRIRWTTRIFSVAPHYIRIRIIAAKYFQNRLEWQLNSCQIWVYYSYISVRW